MFLYVRQACTTQRWTTASNISEGFIVPLLSFTPRRLVSAVFYVLSAKTPGKIQRLYNISLNAENCNIPHKVNPSFYRKVLIISYETWLRQDDEAKVLWTCVALHFNEFVSYLAINVLNMESAWHNKSPPLTLWSSVHDRLRRLMMQAQAQTVVYREILNPFLHCVCTHFKCLQDRNTRMSGAPPNLHL